LTGFDVALGSTQPASTIFWMRMMAVVIPAVMIVIALILIRFYSITETVAHNVRIELQRRKND